MSLCKTWEHFLKLMKDACNVVNLMRKAQKRYVEPTEKGSVESFITGLKNCARAMKSLLGCA